MDERRVRELRRRVEGPRLRSLDERGSDGEAAPVYSLDAEDMERELVGDEAEALGRWNDTRAHIVANRRGGPRVIVR